MASFGKEFADYHGLETMLKKPSSGFHWVVIRFATTRLALAFPMAYAFLWYLAIRSRCISCGILPSRDYSEVDCHHC